MKLPFGDSLEEFLDHSLSGHVFTSSRGEIINVNAKVVEWLGLSREQLIGKKITSLLAVGSRIFYETHLSPLLKLKGYFEEISAELLLADGSKMQVLINGYTRNDDTGNEVVVCLNIYRATDRRVYEDNLRNAITNAENIIKTERELAILREQFIAVLGHDLRNPLGAIKTGSALLARSLSSDRDKSILGTITKSTLRMEEMITNVMDFARVRLGGGILLNRNEVLVEPIIMHIVNELTISFPQRTVVCAINTEKAVSCDVNRLSQMLSNLLANALTHGAADKPVRIIANTTEDYLEIDVINGGRAIPQEIIGSLFEPFTREANTPSQQGLGLGLYIAAQIASAHGGLLEVSSDADETCFSFRMPLVG
ncbi:hypothetical protein AB669_13605 [Pedobacter sp. BMA]|nr:hypothetical protein AB669_13605 [Pedobacter sp. BMA]